MPRAGDAPLPLRAERGPRPQATRTLARFAAPLFAAPLCALALLGCASNPARRAPAASSEAVDAWLAREPTPPPIRFANPGALLPQADPLAASSLSPRHPGSTGAPIDVSFHRAPLGSALRLLAEAADLGIVLGEGLTAPVDVELRRVRPMDAMYALAQAHRVELTLRGRTVIARLSDGVR